MLLVNNESDVGKRNLHERPVLIIDHEGANQEIIINYLKAYHITAVTVSAATEALNQIDKDIFALIFLNLDFSALDAFEFVHAARHNNHNLPLVGFSIQNLEAISLRCFESGINAILSKPLEQADLAEVISLFLPEINESSSPRLPAQNNYQFINLIYLKEISIGDATFEQEITTKFLSVISENLLAFQQYLEAGDIIKLKATAHYTRSTIFIMGLNRLLDQFLNAIEYGDLPLKELNVQVKNVVKIIEEAREEVRGFLNTLH